MKLRHQISEGRSTSTIIETIDQVSNALLYIKEEDDIFNIIEDAIKKLLPNVYFLVSKLQPDDFNFRVIKHYGFDHYLNAITKIVGKDPTSIDFPLTNLSEEQQTSMKSRKLHHFSDGVYSFVNGLVNRTISKALEKLLGISEVCAIEIISNHSSTVIQKLRDQSALIESEKRVELAVESAGIGMWEFDIQNKTYSCSNRHDQIFGYETMQNAWNKDIFKSHILPDDLDYVKKAFEEAFNKKSLYFECRIKDAQGNIKWISEHGLIQNDKQG